MTDNRPKPEETDKRAADDAARAREAKKEPKGLETPGLVKSKALREHEDSSLTRDRARIGSPAVEKPTQATGNKDGGGKSQPAGDDGGAERRRGPDRRESPVERRIGPPNDRRAVDRRNAQRTFTGPDQRTSDNRGTKDDLRHRPDQRSGEERRSGPGRENGSPAGSTSPERPPGRGPGEARAIPSAGKETQTVGADTQTKTAHAGALPTPRHERTGAQNPSRDSQNPPTLADRARNVVDHVKDYGRIGLFAGATALAAAGVGTPASSSSGEASRFHSPPELVAGARAKRQEIEDATEKATKATEASKNGAQLPT